MGNELFWKACKHCGIGFVAKGKQTVCENCRKEVHKIASSNWYKNGYKNTSKNLPVLFFVNSGKWYWEGKGLTNGPFDTLSKARNDARKAFN